MNESLDDKRNKLAVADYSKTNADLARELNITTKTVAHWRKKLGYQSHPRGKVPVSADQRFARDVDKHSSPYGCWLWTGGLDKGGYGLLYDKSRKMTAHRYSWTIHRGPVPGGLGVLHNCPGGDNRSCVNPAHLWLGTNADNVRDMCQKGRQAKGDLNGTRKYPECVKRGEDAGQSKLTVAQVLEVRRRVSAGEMQKVVGQSLGVSQGQVGRIVRRENWAHVP